MVKKIFLLCFLVGSIHASVYKNNCVSCHEKMPVKIDKFFYRYLLKYSSEDALKNALIKYLKNPTKEKTILQEGLLNRFGVKEKTTLNDKDLKKAVDEYWEIYKIFGKLK
ncbi:hypothetical protein [Sulfurospirillum arcachonense]|uniref:hypothetical protein n=1 Tax=Sulfurospirillum arcachonense TaxID=57666 RepID=UPI00046991B2|nr:hypothetical protein [Sulfurospirillum arcachonense]